MSERITREAIEANAKERLIAAIRAKDRFAIAGVLRERVLTDRQAASCFTAAAEETVREALT